MKRSKTQSLPRLPPFIAPMLSKPGTAFDSKEYLFEIKWDGTRTLAFIEDGKVRLLNRRQADMTSRYPEYGFLAGLPNGTVLDGEMVVLQGGKPNFSSLLSREQARSPLKIRMLAKAMPATYIVFDVLYLKHRSLLNEPLEVRRRHLRTLVEKYGQGKLVLSESVPGQQGKAFFREVCQMGLEGVIAKRHNSHYQPGRRSDAWIKIKRALELVCEIIGFMPSGTKDFQSLILATRHDGKLECVGKVGTGFKAKLRAHLNLLFRQRLQATPLVPNKYKGKWIQPGLFCRVSCMEKTARGELRAPVFLELLEE